MNLKWSTLRTHLFLLGEGGGRIGTPKVTEGLITSTLAVRCAPASVTEPQKTDLKFTFSLSSSMLIRICPLPINQHTLKCVSFLHWQMDRILRISVSFSSEQLRTALCIHSCCLPHVLALPVPEPVSPGSWSVTFSLNRDRQYSIDLIIVQFSEASVAVSIHKYCSLKLYPIIFVALSLSGLVTPAAALLAIQWLQFWTYCDLETLRVNRTLYKRAELPFPLRVSLSVCSPLSNFYK